MKYKLPTTYFIEQTLNLTKGNDYDNTNHPLSITAFNFYDFLTWRAPEGYPIPPNPATNLTSITPLNNNPLEIPSEYIPEQITVNIDGSTYTIGYEYILKFKGTSGSNWDITTETENDKTYILITAPTDTTITTTALLHKDSSNTKPLFYISHDDIIINTSRIVYFHITNSFYIPQLYIG